MNVSEEDLLKAANALASYRGMAGVSIDWLKNIKTLKGQLATRDKVKISLTEKAK